MSSSRRKSNGFFSGNRKIATYAALEDDDEFNADETLSSPLSSPPDQTSLIALSSARQHDPIIDSSLISAISVSHPEPSSTAQSSMIRSPLPTIRADSESVTKSSNEKNQSLLKSKPLHHALNLPPQFPHRKIKTGPLKDLVIPMVPLLHPHHETFDGETRGREGATWISNDITLLRNSGHLNSADGKLRDEARRNVWKTYLPLVALLMLMLVAAAVALVLLRASQDRPLSSGSQFGSIVSAAMRVLSGISTVHGPRCFLVIFNFGLAWPDAVSVGFEWTRAYSYLFSSYNHAYHRLLACFRYFLLLVRREESGVGEEVVEKSFSRILTSDTIDKSCSNQSWRRWNRLFYLFCILFILLMETMTEVSRSQSSGNSEPLQSIRELISNSSAATWNSSATSISQNFSSPLLATDFNHSQIPLNVERSGSANQKKDFHVSFGTTLPPFLIDVLIFILIPCFFRARIFSLEHAHHLKHPGTLTHSTLITLFLLFS